MGHTQLVPPWRGGGGRSAAAPGQYVELGVTELSARPEAPESPLGAQAPLFKGLHPPPVLGLPLTHRAGVPGAARLPLCRRDGGRGGTETKVAVSHLPRSLLWGRGWDAGPRPTTHLLSSAASGSWRPLRVEKV